MYKKIHKLTKRSRHLKLSKEKKGKVNSIFLNSVMYRASKITDKRIIAYSVVVIVATTAAAAAAAVAAVVVVVVGG